MAVAAAPKTVIPFDFISRFDKGRYGATVGDMIWKKLNQQKGFVLPESMLDVREACTRSGVQPAPDMALDRVEKLVTEEFGGQIGIWGSVERAPGTTEDIYDLVIKCVDFSAAGSPKVIYQCKARTKTVSEIPHVYVQELLAALGGRPTAAASAGSLAANPSAEANWKKNPNLLIGGDFQEGSGGIPYGWEAVAGQNREPLGGLVRWTPESGSGGNKIVRFQFDASVGDNEGVMYYSLPFPIDEGATYRFQCRWRTSGPAVKVFVKCYDQLGSEYRGEKDTPAKSSAGRPEAIPKITELREVYRSQQNLKGPAKTWNVHSQDFTPKHSQYTPRWCRLMLYAYLGAGVVEFDDVIVKQIEPAVPGVAAKKERRHSQESTVTTKEMEDNER